jgi:hypothetical protein
MANIKRSIRLFIHNNGYSIPLAGLVFLFVFSLFVYLIFSDREVERILFFPGNLSGEISGEPRVLEDKGAQEENIRRLIQELILGPLSILHAQIMPKETKIQVLMFRKGDVYIDFSNDVLFPTNETPLTFAEAMEALKKTLFFNFTSIDDIHITVDGQIPFSPPYYGSITSNQ